MSILPTHFGTIYPMPLTEMPMHFGDNPSAYDYDLAAISWIYGPVAQPVRAVDS